MPDLMLECEVKKQFVKGARREWRWVKVEVSRIFDAAPEHIRCLYCHGAVRVRKQKGAGGQEEHLEHKVKGDSEGCPGGSHFTGQAKMSSNPVT